MRTKNKSVMFGMAAVATGLLAFGGSLFAQNAAIAPPAPGADMFYEAMGPGPGEPPDAIGFVEFEEGVSGKTVSGAPFTASFSMQTTQVLSDGNQIQRSTTGSLARDSQGRTRRDMTLPAIGPWAAAGKPAPQMTFINDPVAGAQFTLDANRKIAHKRAGRGHKGGDFARGPRSHDGGFATEREKETTTTSLGTQMINGVSAEGTRVTRTIPAGEIGNQKPIVITVEKWYSPDLQETVMTKRSDPRMGEKVFQLTNIQRSEPAATLFQVPADYTVKEGGPGGRRGMHSRHGAGPGMPPGPPPASSSSPTR
ncbi:MAG: hypothetical protein ACRD59_17095 [Candidatus Acidiferrales bacterium]